MSDRNNLSGDTQQSAETQTRADVQAKADAPKAKKAKTALIIIIIAVAAACLFVGYTVFFDDGFLSGGQSGGYVIDSGVIYDGAECMGVDLSGMTAQEAAQAVEKACEEKTNEVKLTVDINGTKVELDAQDLGAKIDSAKVAENAYLYGREGTLAERIAAVGEKSYEVPYSLEYSEDTIKQSIEAKTQELSLVAQDATYNITKEQDEDKLTCDLKFEIVPEKDGVSVDYDKLMQDIEGVLSDNEKMTSNEEITASCEVTKAQIDTAYIEEHYQKLGTYSTEYKDSNYNRKYNIWKMASIINGVVIEPGETWSINEEAGPRTYDRGWKGAPGISNGEYKEEAGGGICQVSTTLYNAVLRTEVEVVDRSHHSWPLSYAPTGLDATISTGSPDFKIKNTFDTSIIIAAKCDGGAGTIEVSIYRPKMDYTLDFYSKVVETSYTAGTQTIVDNTMAPGTSRTAIKEHPRVVANVYKQKFDLDGNRIGGDELYSTEVYAAKPAKVYVGPAASETPEASAQPETETPVTPDPAPTPEPTPAETTEPAA